MIRCLFVHGNVSSSLFWQPLMLALPERYRPIAVDLRGFGDTDPEPVDATRGVRDYSDDVLALMQALELPPTHLIGWSLGGGVVLQCLVDAPGLLASLTLVDPVSPFGFGGSHGVEGLLSDPPGVGSGGGCANPAFVAQLASGDRGADSPLSPRQVLLAHYVKPPFVPEHLDIFVESMLSTRIGENNYPGDSTTVDAWPGIAPGHSGRAQHPGAQPLPDRRSLRRRTPDRRSCGSGEPTTSSSPTPRSMTSPSSDSWA